MESIIVSSYHVNVSLQNASFAQTYFYSTVKKIYNNYVVLQCLVDW